MVTRLLPAADVAIDPGVEKPRLQRGAEQEMIKAEAGITAIGIAKIIPKRIDFFPWVKRP